jgi:hypothetical protein
MHESEEFCSANITNSDNVLQYQAAGLPLTLFCSGVPVMSSLP